MRSVIVFAVLALAVAGAVPKFSGPNRPVPEAQAKAAAPDPFSVPDNYRSMTITRGPNGHFNVTAEIDGRRMEFLVDTGASVVALTARDAARLGIRPPPGAFTADVKTANGMVRAAPVELTRVDVGSLTVRNVQAIVLPDEALGENLLGMSFLSRVRWTYERGRLVIEQ